MIRWGGLVLDAVQVSTSRRRALVRHLPARGNGGDITDAGAELREWRVTVQWTRRGRGDDPEKRYQALKARNDGQTRLLVIPGERAVPTKMSIESEDRSSGHPDCALVFVEDRGDIHVQGSQDAQTMSAQTTIQTVMERAQAAEAALADVGLPTTVATDSVALAASWRATGQPEAADVPNSARTQQAAISAALADSEAVDDPSRLDVYFALLDLSAALADAAELATTHISGRVALTIDEPATLLALAASLYGAETAEQRATEIARINLLHSENALPAPMTLLIPAVT